MPGRKRHHSEPHHQKARGLDLLFNLHYIRGIDEKKCTFKCDFTILVCWEYFQSLEAFQSALVASGSEAKAEDLVYRSLSRRRTPWNCDSKIKPGISAAELQKLRQGSGEMKTQLMHEANLLQERADELTSMTWDEFTVNYVSTVVWRAPSS
jgi:hypothetical protein